METREELQERSLNEAKIRAEAFQAMMMTEGWKLVQAYYENNLKQFASSMLIDEKRETKDFDGERHELMGLRKLFAYIDGDIETAKTYKNEEV